jgi:hypothetical protein
LGGAAQRPSQLDPNQYAQVANYARQQHPDAMQEVVREQPWFMKAMGHPVLMGALGMVASHMIKNRMQSSQAGASRQEGGGLLRRLF